MTEERAKATRCCGPEGCGHTSTYDGLRFCIGSNCMGWRWRREETSSPQVTKLSNTDGYCGLAGRSE